MYLASRFWPKITIVLQPFLGASLSPKYFFGPKDFMQVLAPPPPQFLFLKRLSFVFTHICFWFKGYAEESVRPYLDDSVCECKEVFLRSRSPLVYKNHKNSLGLYHLFEIIKVNQIF